MRSQNIIFVHGLFGWGPGELLGIPYWGKALNDGSLRPHRFRFTLHEASCGPISSFHDRACEVAAQIKGTQVDYGKEHSQQANHKHLSDDFTSKAFVENWSEDNPVVLIGHSAGGHTCLKLQQLLAENFWGWGSNENWVEAIIPISAVLNGSTLPYKFGCDKDTGRLSTSGIGGFISEVVNKLPRASSHFYDFDLDQWIGTGHKSFDEMKIALEKSDFANGEDNLAYDLSLQGCHKANQTVKTYPDTYYFSIVTEQTIHGSPEDAMNSLLKPSAIYQGQAIEFETNPIPNWGLGDLHIDKWRENDGAVSSISQRYPFTSGNHPVGGEGIFNKTNDQLETGKWYFEKAEAITGGTRLDHLDISIGYEIPFPNEDAEVAHKKLYQKIYELLNRL